MSHTVILRGDAQRAYAKQLIDAAPVDAVVSVKGPTRNKDQNALMWVLLTEISRAKPLGRSHIPEVWKSILMSACGHQVQFILGIDGEMFPAGFKTSKLTVPQMAELIEYIYWFGAENGVNLL